MLTNYLIVKDEMIGQQPCHVMPCHACHAAKDRRMGPPGFPLTNRRLPQHPLLLEDLLQ